MSLWLSLFVARAATLNVGPGQPYPTIQDAVDVADDGDVIAIAAGSYDEVVVVDDLDVVFSALGLVEWTGQDDSLLKVYDSEVSVLGVTFRPRGGRGLRAEGSVVSVTNCEFSGNDGNRAAYNGAAIAVYAGSTVSIDNTLFEQNTTRASVFGSVSDGYGGHIIVDDGDLIVEQSTFRQGRGVAGGAIYVTGDADVRLSDTTFDGNEATDSGGQIWAGGEATITIERTTFTGGQAPNYGGAIRWRAATGALTVLSSVFIGNSAGQYGGAIATNETGRLTLLDNRFEGGRADHGGAVSLVATDAVTARRNAFCDNVSADEGGAVRVSASGDGVWTNNTFIASKANGEDGGAMWVSDADRQVILNNDFLDSLTGGVGGALRVQGADADVRNNLIAWVTGGYGVSADDAAVTLDWTGWFQVLPGTTEPPLAQGVNGVVGNPLLLGYRRNGVCDDDLRLRVGSPLIDAGDPSILDPDGSRSDIGAFGGPDAPAFAFDDADGDGALGAYDCDDDDVAVRPGALERCDGLDNDCDGVVDGPNTPGAPTWYPDDDGDGAGDVNNPLVACAPPPGYVDLGGDCDDTNGDARPGNAERCNGFDDNCDGRTDGTDAQGQLTWFEDVDGDGFGTRQSSIAACAGPVGYVLSDADCDDANIEIRPDADERCDGIDNNCDGRVDGDDAVDRLPWYVDADGDGWGVPGDGTVFACSKPATYARTDDDCDDGDTTVHPFADEVCDDTVDRNCDGSVGDADLDQDGFRACEDCDDTDPSAFPGAPDVPYDGVLTDCDRSSDFDADADGYESDAWGGTDCDDDDPAINPGAVERAGDDVDSDCDGDIGTDAFLDEDVRAACGGCDARGRSPALGVAALVAWALRRRGAARR